MSRSLKTVLHDMHATLTSLQNDIEDVRIEAEDLVAEHALFHPNLMIDQEHEAIIDQMIAANDHMSGELQMTKDCLNLLGVAALRGANKAKLLKDDHQDKTPEPETSSKLLIAGQVGEILDERLPAG